MSAGAAANRPPHCALAGLEEELDMAGTAAPYVDRRLVLAGGATLMAALAVRKLAAQEFRPLTDIHALPPAPLPNLSFTGLDGAPVRLAAFRGKPLVLNFWATWCPPCVAELPELDQLAAGGAVGVLAVSTDRMGAARVAPFLAAHKLPHLTVALDSALDAAHALHVAGFPTTLIIDAAGQLRGRLEGPAAWGAGAGFIQHFTA